PRSSRGHAVRLVPRGVGGQDEGGDLAGRGARGDDGGRSLGGHGARAWRRAHPRRDGARNALDIGSQRRVVLDVIRGVLADDVDDARAGLPRVVKIGQAVAEPRPQREQGGRRLVGHTPVAVGGPGYYAFEETEHAADAVDLVEGGHEVHFRRTGIGEAHVDPARYQGSYQDLRTAPRGLLGSWDAERAADPARLAPLATRRHSAGRGTDHRARLAISPQIGR